MRTTATEAGSACEEADKTWNDVLFSLGRDMREPVNTIQDMAHVAGQAAREPQLRGFLDEIVSAGRALRQVERRIGRAARSGTKHANVTGIRDTRS
jgi:light-regulated signal transduction histidine kinase (bacteriophytochrome)